MTTTTTTRLAREWADRDRWLREAAAAFSGEYGVVPYRCQSRFVDGEPMGAWPPTRDPCPMYLDHARHWRVRGRGGHRLGTPDLVTASPYGLHCAPDALAAWCTRRGARFLALPGVHLHSGDDLTIAFWRAGDSELDSWVGGAA